MSLTTTGEANNMTSSTSPSPGSRDPEFGHRYYLDRTGQRFGPFTLQDLRTMAAAGQVKPTNLLLSTDGGSRLMAKDIPWLFSDKGWITALIISFFFGALGIDRFYLGYTAIGLAKLFTIGGLGIWALIDLVLIALRRVPDADGLPLR
jgi:hypothetical protein